MNDFEAIAYSIPFIGAEDKLVVGPLKGTDLDNRSFDVAILGPGTGLGVAGLSSRKGALLAITGEGGHVGFAPESVLAPDSASNIYRVRTLRPSGFLVPAAWHGPILRRSMRCGRSVKSRN